MDKRTEYSNIPLSIEAKLGRNLHNQKNHPIEIIKKKLFDYFKTLDEYNFVFYDDLSPFVSTEDCFDKLLLPKDHPARRKSDTYYVNENIILRTHMTTYDTIFLKQGIDNFITVGDVYRKDEVDRSHYPVFHQLDCVAKVKEGIDSVKELKRILNGLVEYLFPDCKYRVNPDYFPFTEPSFEYEVYFNNKWLEILGSGILHKDILIHNNLEGEYIAFGLGIDRLVMIFNEIPDIRYLWSIHPRFIDQFSSGEVIKFKAYSELPTMSKDISFWIPSNKIVEDNDEFGKPVTRWIEENDFLEMAREKFGEWTEEVKLMDDFFHPKKKLHSKMFRSVFSPIDPSLIDPRKFSEICNKLQNEFRVEVGENLDVILR